MRIYRVKNWSLLPLSSPSFIIVYWWRWWCHYCYYMSLSDMTNRSVARWISAVCVSVLTKTRKIELNNSHTVDLISVYFRFELTILNLYIVYVRIVCCFVFHSQWGRQWRGGSTYKYYESHRRLLTALCSISQYCGQYFTIAYCWFSSVASERCSKCTWYIYWPPTNTLKIVMQTVSRRNSNNKCNNNRFT